MSTTGQAWVTLVTNDSYALGALVLAQSLRRCNTIHQLAVLITPSVSGAMTAVLSEHFDLVKVVDVLDSKDATNLAVLARPDLGVTFTKLHCWNLTQYSKCVFLDADTLVVKNSDELFEREELSAAPDAGWPDCFNSGVFVYTPSETTFKALLDFALAHGSFDGADQGLLNMFFSDWATKDIAKHLPFVYNMVATASYTYLPAFNVFGGNVKIAHFIGSAKPWLQANPSSPTQSNFLDLWWNIFKSDVSNKLNIDMGGLAGALAGGQQDVIDDQWRKQSWEQGNIDYMGMDAFENIWRKMSETVGEDIKPLHASMTEVPEPETTLEVGEPLQVPEKIEDKAELPKIPENTEVLEETVKATNDITKNDDVKLEVVSDLSAALQELVATEPEAPIKAQVSSSVEIPLQPSSEIPSAATRSGSSEIATTAPVEKVAQPSPHPADEMSREESQTTSPAIVPVPIGAPPPVENILEPPIGDLKACSFPKIELPQVTPLHTLPSSDDEVSQATSPPAADIVPLTIPHVTDSIQQEVLHPALPPVSKPSPPPTDNTSQEAPQPVPPPISKPSPPTTPSADNTSQVAPQPVPSPISKPSPPEPPPADYTSKAVQQPPPPLVNKASPPATPSTDKVPTLNPKSRAMPPYIESLPQPPSPAVSSPVSPSSPEGSKAEVTAQPVQTPSIHPSALTLDEQTVPGAPQTAVRDAPVPPKRKSAKGKTKK